MQNNTKQSNSMRISNKRLLEFSDLFYQKTGKKLSESEALTQAEILLQTVAILYQPVSVDDFNSALIKKAIMRKKRLLLI